MTPDTGTDTGTADEPLGPARPQRCWRCTNTLDRCDCNPIPQPKENLR